jgi:acyl carrier protein
MTETSIFEDLKPLIVEALGVPPHNIHMDSVLVRDLGAESIDLLDLSFQIESRFGVTLEANEMEREARRRMPEGVYERDGCLTDDALAVIRSSVPGLDTARLVPGIRKTDLPSLLTVAFFVHLIARKLAARTEGAPHA